MQERWAVYRSHDGKHWSQYDMYMSEAAGREAADQYAKKNPDEWWTVRKRTYQEVEVQTWEPTK